LGPRSFDYFRSGETIFFVDILCRFAESHRLKLE
jgi:hypothetical protein